MPSPRNNLISEFDEVNQKLTEAIERIKAATEYSADGSNGAGGGSVAKSKRFRKLRIAWTVAWVLACMTLLVFWALSYSEMNRWDIQLGRSSGINVWIMFERIIAEPNIGPQQWETTRESLDSTDREEWTHDRPQWDLGMNDRFQWTIPIWFPVLLSSAFAALPWIPWSTRFSIRAILILTTLVAAVLGLIMYSLSK